MTVTTEWWVYVLRSERPRFNSKGMRLVGFHYVGSTTDPSRRLRQHNGEIKGGGKYTAQHRPWVPAALYGPYGSRSEAFKAEMALKKGKRSVGRTQWSTKDSPWCRGLGAADPWVTGHDPSQDAPAPATESLPQRRRLRRKRMGRRRRR